MAVADGSTVAPGSAPGALWGRLVCDDCGPLLAHAITTDTVEIVSTGDADVAKAHAELGHVVRNHIYDGDSGVCLITAVVG